MLNSNALVMVVGQVDLNRWVADATEGDYGAWCMSTYQIARACGRSQSWAVKWTKRCSRHGFLAEHQDVMPNGVTRTRYSVTDRGQEALAMTAHAYPENAAIVWLHHCFKAQKFMLNPTYGSEWTIE